MIHEVELTMHPGVRVQVEDAEYADLKAMGLLLADHGEAGAGAPEPASAGIAPDSAPPPDRASAGVDEGPS